MTHVKLLLLAAAMFITTNAIAAEQKFLSVEALNEARSTVRTVESIYEIPAANSNQPSLFRPQDIEPAAGDEAQPIPSHPDKAREIK